MANQVEFEGIVKKIQNTYRQQETTGYLITLELPENPNSREKVKRLYDVLNSPCKIKVAQSNAPRETQTNS